MTIILFLLVDFYLENVLLLHDACILLCLIYVFSSINNEVNFGLNLNLFQLKNYKNKVNRYHSIILL